MRRLALIGVVLLGLAVVLPGSIRPSAADAHGGAVAVRTTAGPYHVEATISRADKLIDETIRIGVADTKEVVTTAVVTVSLHDAQGAAVGTYPARLSGDVYEVRYPPAEGDGWRVRIGILGLQGTEVAEHPFKAPAKEWAIASGPTGIILNIAALLLLFGMPVLAYRNWFRPEPSGARTPDDAATVRSEET